VPEFSALGARLLAVSPQEKMYSRELIKEKQFSFELLSDTGNKVAKTFGLVYTLPDDLRQLYVKFGIDLEKYNGDETWTLPIPARYLIDQKGIIRYVKADPDYTVRPEPEDTLTALKEITQ